MFVARAYIGESALTRRPSSPASEPHTWFPRKAHHQGFIIILSTESTRICSTALCCVEVSAKMSLNFSDLTNFDFNFDLGITPEGSNPFSDPLTSDSGTSQMSSPLPDFTTPIDNVTDSLSNQTNGGISFNTSNASPIAPSPMAISPPSIYGQAPPTRCIYPDPQISPIAPVGRQWTPCAPPRGAPLHPPPEPRRWTPCASPTGQPAHLPRASSRRWRPCNPPPNVRKWRPCSPPPSAQRRPMDPQPVARTPFHVPGMSSRLGLQKCAYSPVEDIPRPPRSIPAQRQVSQALPIRPLVSTLDPSLLMLGQRTTAQPTFTAPPSLDNGSQSTKNPEPSSVTSPDDGMTSISGSSSVTLSSARRGSIHLEDLYSANEDSDNSDCSLSPPPPSPSSPNPYTSNLHKRKTPSSFHSQQKRRKSRLVAEIEDTREYSDAHSHFSKSDDGDDENDIFIPNSRFRDNKGKCEIRRSGRQRSSVISYAE